MIAILRPLTLALAVVLTLFITAAIGDEEADFDSIINSALEIVKSDRRKLEEMRAIVAGLKTIHAVEACRDFRAAIDAFDIHGGEAKRKIDRVFDSAFAVIDAAEGDHARTAANLAFDLTKGLGANSNNPWYFEAGFRVIYANVCN